MSWPGAARRDANVSRSDDGGQDRRFPRAARLRKRKSFVEVYDRGHRVHGAYFVLFGLAGAAARSRLGITATKKFGHAVARNRIKRLIREIYRLNCIAPGAPVDVVVNVRPTAAVQPYRRLETDLVSKLHELRRRLGA